MNIYNSFSCCVNYCYFTIFRYKNRIFNALKPENRKRILSLIIDGMDQSHSKCPYFGNQGQCSRPLGQGVTGALIHGVGINIYRTFETVSKGADLTIYIIFAEVENFYKRYGVYPEELYVQLDGGSENANKYVLTCLEYLVSKRVVKVLFFLFLLSIINKTVVLSSWLV